MKKLISNGLMRAIAALSMFSFVGCADFGGIDSQPEQGLNFVTDALSAYTMEAESAENVIFSISSNTPWRIELDDDAEWLHVSPTMSATGGLVADIALSADDNLYHTSRSATITITVPELPECNKTITIKQDSKTDLTVDTFSGTVPAAGGEVVISVTTNKAWEYVAEDDFLADVTIVKESGSTSEGNGEESGDDVAEPATRTYVEAPAPEFDELETYILTINVALNTGVERTGTFKVRLVGGRGEEGKDLQTREIAQSGIELRLADDEPEPVFEAVMDGEGEDANVLYPAYGPGATVTFNVRSSIAFDAVPVDDWIEVVNVTNEERNGMVTGGTVTLKTKGDINPYAGYRVGVVNLTADGLKPVSITVYQKAMFGNNWLVDRATMYCIDNKDQSVTFYPIGSTDNTERLAMVSPITLSMGKKWVMEFDSERTNINKSHLYFHISPDGSASQSNGISRAALTPDIPSAVDGINNNCFLHNGGTWTGNVNRWNIDGVGGSVIPEVLITSDDVKKLENVTFEMTELGVKMTVVANGKEFSYTRLLSDTAEANREKFTTAYKTIEVYAAFGFFNSNYEDEYVTVTKCYFAPIE